MREWPRPSLPGWGTWSQMQPSTSTSAPSRDECPEEEAEAVNSEVAETSLPLNVPGAVLEES